MGGGGAMRAAVKAATSSGLGIPNVSVNTLRGGVLPESFGAGRKSIFNSTSSLSSSTASATHTSPAISCQLDDWEFDGFGVEEDHSRIVFGAPPSLQETKDATSQLSDALDKMYFSQWNSAGSLGSVSAVDEDNFLLKSETLLTDTKTCVVIQKSAVSSVPNQALQAFKMLRENPAAQTVVASLAADPHVWQAVFENEALKEFMLSENNSMSPEKKMPLQSSEDSPDDQDAGNSENVFMNVYENIKLSVAGWVTNLSGFFQEWFGGSDVNTKPGNSSLNSTVAGRSLFGLAVMVIMFIIMKRR